MHKFPQNKQRELSCQSNNFDLHIYILYLSFFIACILQWYFFGQVLTDSYVDVEKAAHLSEEHILFLYLALPPRLSYQDTITLKVSLPIHVRYHPPSPDPQVSFANVTLSYPHVLLNCSRSGRYKMMVCYIVLYK